MLPLHHIPSFVIFLSVYMIFKNKTREECYVRYLESVMDEVLHYDDYDSLAHLGYIGRYAPWEP